jgi:hypothetical protein
MFRAGTHFLNEASKSKSTSDQDQDQKPQSDIWKYRFSSNADDQTEKHSMRSELHNMVVNSINNNSSEQLEAWFKSLTEDEKEVWANRETRGGKTPIELAIVSQEVKPGWWATLRGKTAGITCNDGNVQIRQRIVDLLFPYTRNKTKIRGLVVTCPGLTEPADTNVHGGYRRRKNRKSRQSRKSHRKSHRKTRKNFRIL